MEVRFTQHSIFGSETLMLERKDVGRNQPVGDGHAVKMQTKLCRHFRGPHELTL